MKNSLQITARICAGSLFVFTFAAGLLHAQDATPSPSAAHGKEPALSAAEEKYLQGVVTDNLGEIATGYLAIEKSASDSVKSYAEDVIDTHTKTMKQVMELAAKHDAFLKLQPDLSSYEKLTSVGGGEFDKLYTAEAQRLNQEAIDQLKPLMGQLTASDVKAFAEDDLKDDQKHLKSAQDLAAKLQKD